MYTKAQLYIYVNFFLFIGTQYLNEHAEGTGVMHCAWTTIAVQHVSDPPLRNGRQQQQIWRGAP